MKKTRKARVCAITILAALIIFAVLMGIIGVKISFPLG